MAKKLGFVLGAGGARGIAHIGFLQAMEEKGIKPDYITGCSMGSVVGACYASGMSPDKMKAVATSLKLNHIFDLSANIWGNGALLRANKMYEKIKECVGNVTFNELKIPFKCVATDLISGELVVFGGDREVAKCVAASSSIPGVFRPTEMDGMRLVDGAIKCRVPIEQIREMGAETVVVVDVLGHVRPTKKKLNVLTVLLRSFDIMDSDIARGIKNEQKPDLIIEPDLEEMSQYKFKDIEFAYNVGYETGLENASKIKKLIK